MKILWITNTIFPAPSKKLGLPISAFGGWMYGLAGQLAAIPDMKLAVATVYPGTDLKIYEIDNVRYYLLPCRVTKKYQKNLEHHWRRVMSDFSPDVVHIHGTEYLHGLACLRSCNEFNYLVSIQGLTGVCARYYYSGLTTFDILRNITIRDLIRWDTIFHGKRNFVKQGFFEKEYLARCGHVTGRTSWDYAHAKAMNSKVTYHFCNETLRDGFYSSAKWAPERKSDYTIFLSQSGYPIKGLHQVLKAVALLKNDFPDIKVRVAGTNIINRNTLIDRFKITGFGSYVYKLINRLDLSKQVVFTGILSEKEMIKEYLSAHLFICPSSIENSPNSLGEAQILGVPTIASFVGGVADMVEHGKTGLLYRFEEIEMLAEQIRSIFNSPQLAKELSKQGIIAAAQRHNQDTNRHQIIHIYSRVAKRNNKGSSGFCVRRVIHSHGCPAPIKGGRRGCG